MLSLRFKRGLSTPGWGWGLLGGRISWGVPSRCWRRVGSVSLRAGSGWLVSPVLFLVADAYLFVSVCLIISRGWLLS